MTRCMRPAPQSRKASCRAAALRCCAPSSCSNAVKTTNEDQKHGVEIVKKAITSPARQIAINSGEDGSVVVAKIIENDTYGYGFDAQTGEFGNLVTKGIIDPTKVVRIALQDGASIAGLLITTEAMVAEKPKKETWITNRRSFR
jgi:chaperonin GroEL